MNATRVILHQVSPYTSRKLPCEASCVQPVNCGDIGIFLQTCMFNLANE